MGALLKIGYYSLALLALLLGVLLLLVQTSILPNFAVKIVQSGSMEPAISTGSLVVIKAEERYHTGEVITFTAERTSDIPTTHRIVRDTLEEGQLVYHTQGDANNAVDPQPVLPENVLGKVILSVPFLGYLLDFARQPLGFVLLIGVPAGLILFEEISNIVSEVRQKPASKREDEEEIENIDE